MRTRVFAITTTCLFAFLIAGCICFSIPLVEKTQSLDETVISGNGRDKILLIDISGVLSTEEKDGLFSFRKEASIVARIREELKKATTDKRIKGLILRVNSPGGTVTSSDIIYREIKKFKERKGLPVIACIMELAASGGYYVSLASDAIIAHPTSVTGSIGVIALKFNAKGLMKKIGIEDETIKAGDKKDLWSPFRPSTEEEREIMQNMLDDFHGKFMDIVAEGRKELTRERIKVLADGRIYSAEQALKEKLIDGIGYLDDVIELVKEKAGVDKAKVIVYHRPYSYKNNIYSRMSNSDFKNINLVNLDLGGLLDNMGLSFMYLWLP
ncbi:MAG: signal peptide peptidase SppA [Deltaproteobacteria bacterium]|nr:signal peptide peptidase SppA [Deltaproteobacteria bacterium]